MLTAIEILPARWETHSDIMRIARQTKFTRDFGNTVMFSSPERYAEGSILVARRSGTMEVVGFSCVRHQKRKPLTKLYFLGVDEALRSRGVGRVLLREVERSSPHKRVQFDVAEDNPRARQFYEREGYAVVSTKPPEFAKPGYWVMEKSW